MFLDLNTILQFLLRALIYVFASGVLYFVFEKSPLKKINRIYSQIIIGIIFGLLTIFENEIGVSIEDAIGNVRDAGPLCAGLLFGGPAGIISGVIGGVWRWFSVLWNASGEYTRVACTISTIFAGVYSAILRKWIFDNKKPSHILAFFTGVVMEVIHLTMVFVTHLTEPEKAFNIVQILTLPMLIGNGLAIMLSTVLVSILSREFHRKKFYPAITHLFQIPMLIAVILAFLFSTLFVFQLQSYSARESTKTLIKLNIEDVKKQIDKQEDKSRLTENLRIGETGHIIIADKNYNIISDIAGSGITSEDVQMVLKDENKRDEIIEKKFGDTKYIYLVSEIDDCYVIAVMTADEVYKTRDATAIVNSYMEILVFAALFIVIYVIIKRVVVDNLHKINRSLSEIIGGDLSTQVDVHSSEEFASLSDDINSTVATLKKYIDEAASRIDAELAFAKSIQQSSLPSVFPAFPNHDEFEIYASMQAAKQVGGDFYDFYFTDSTHLAFLIADVSDKGIPAAMFMMRAKTIIKSLAESGLSVDEIFTRANEKLCEENEAEMFVTAWMAIINTETGEMHFANAGHNPPLICRNNREYEYLKSQAGFVLGGLPGLKYKSVELNLNNGDKLFLYTDGVTEAANTDGELFGETRLNEKLNEIRALSSEDTAKAVADSLEDFTAGAEQSDDITMLTFNYK